MWAAFETVTFLIDHEMSQRTVSFRRKSAHASCASTWKNSNVASIDEREIMFNFIQRFEAVLFKLCDVAKILQRFTNSATTRLQNYLNSRTPKAFLEIILKFRITRENIKVRFTLEQDKTTRGGTELCLLFLQPRRYRDVWSKLRARRFAQV